MYKKNAGLVLDAFVETVQKTVKKGEKNKESSICKQIVNKLFITISTIV